MSKKFETEEPTKTEEKTFYIFIFFSQNKEKEIAFEFDSKKTEIFYVLKEKNNGIFRNIFIIKHKHTIENKSEIVNLSFKNKEEIFKITFNANEGTFIFSPSLKIQKNKFSNERSFSQINVIKNKDKIHILTKCLEEKKENDKISLLYNDAVELFKLNKDFELIFFYLNKFVDLINALKM